MGKGIKIINRAGNSLDVKVDDTGAEIRGIMEYPERSVALSALKEGTVFSRDGVGYILLKQFSHGASAVIRKEVLDEAMVFGNSNDWRISGIRRYLNDVYLKGLADTFGERAIWEHVADLLSLDGLGEYGQCTDKVGLLSLRQYWQYRGFACMPAENLSVWKFYDVCLQIGVGRYLKRTELCRSAGDLWQSGVFLLERGVCCF